MKKNEKLTEQKADLVYLTGERRNIDMEKERSNQRRDSLVARLRASDRTAATELVDIYYEQIYLYLRRLGHDRQVSEDLTQESFLNAWHHIGQLRDGKALDSWLYRIASNVSKLYWRKHKHKEVVGIEGIDIKDSNEGEFDEFGYYEKLEQLKKGIARLPFKLRQTIVLHYMQQLTITESAEAAEVKEGTFKSRLNRALKALRKNIT